jgi:cytochrome P450
MLAFGQGRHSCIGRQLALLQIKAMLNALIAGSVTIDDIEEQVWVHRFGHRWPSCQTVQIPA